MAKNNRLINQYKYMYQKTQQITPEVYAGIALALHRRYGWGFKRINDLFTVSQEIWEECADSNLNMCDICEKETGIDIRVKK